MEAGQNINLNEFFKITDFSEKRINNKEDINGKKNIGSSIDGMLFFKAGRGSVTKIFLSDIDYFMGCGNYSKCFVNGEFFLIGMLLKDIEVMLLKKGFVRIHKSYIIQICKIEKIIRHIIYVTGNSAPIPIGSGYREMFYSMIALG